MNAIHDYYGRLFTKYQLTEAERSLATVLPITDKTACPRCATPYAEEHQLPNGSYYCRECILLGRIRSDQELYYFPQQAYPTQKSLNWQGQLTPFQAQISQALCQAVDDKQPSLVHAVTGAGKTEMIYAVVAKVIDKGGAVCIATPRIDVCIELHKRLEQDFNCPVALLHGESEAYFRTPLVIATTHQLLKFYRAFDLLIIDEVDAFPYVDNPMLYHAVDQSTKEDGLQLFLTATSTDELDKRVQSGTLRRLSLPRRFHGNPLVVPQKVWLQGLNKKIEKEELPKRLELRIAEQRRTGFPLLIFAPEIKTGQKLTVALSKVFPEENIGFVSSQTENRLDIVQAFRNKTLTILVSTTILERGVTFPCVDVMVVQANHALYTSSSLVQIGGRVGRSMERPSGDLLFFIEGSNRAIEKAITEIKAMNKEAGYE